MMLALLGSLSLAWSGLLAALPVALISLPGYFTDHALVRVSPNEAVPSHVATAISISAAANEFEGAQIILRGGEVGLQEVNLSLHAPLASERGYVIPPETVRFYREHYVTVPWPSTELGRSGVYPDALIPFRNPYGGAPVGSSRYPAAPFDVPPGKNQPVYVEFFIPPGTTAGFYHGTIRVSGDSHAALADIPVTVKVWNFTLPSSLTLRRGFQSFDGGHYEGPARYMSYAEGSSQHRALAKAIDEMLIEHRLVPESPMGTSLSAGGDGTALTTTGNAARLLSYLKRPEFTDFQLPFRRGFPFRSPTTTDRALALAYLRSAYHWFESHGVADKVFIRPGDEPATVSDFLSIAEMAALIREANPKYKVAMTVDITDPRVGAYFGDHVNRLVAGYWSFDPKEAAAKHAAGLELWSYTALVQNTRNPSPYWQIDFPLHNYRVVPWINFRYGITGLLYWTTAYWGQLIERQASPWVDPCSYRVGRTCYSGDGLLIYPGAEIGLVVPEFAYGSASPVPVLGPVASLRLKTLRDAVEDYEYLVMASQADVAAAMREAVQIGCNGDSSANGFHHWNTDAAALLDARSRLAAIIESARRSRSTAAEPRGTGAGAPRSGRGR